MEIFDKNSIFTVSEITHAIKNNLENEFRFVKVRGEISNLVTPYSGHTYFILKDDSAQIKAVLFKQQKRFVELSPANGQQVFCFGRITVYEPRGEYQLVLDSIQLEGEGLLQITFEKLKNKLSSKGYFSNERKKSLPAYPDKIALITSPTGAAVQDFIKIYAMRNSSIHIQILPVRVQGHLAADEIAHAVTLANTIGGFDIIVLCRGGGSLEDLWAFNEEKVAQAIFESTIPVVTGIGHEIDFTIADFCSDYRCPTPTAAAEKIIPDNETLLNDISNLFESLVRAFRHIVVSSQHKLLQHTRLLQNFNNRVSSERFRLQMSKSYIINTMTDALRKREDELNLLLRKLLIQAPSSQIALQSNHVQFLLKSIKEKMFHIIDQKQAALVSEAKLLHSVSPLATLGRGYSITRQYNSEDKSYHVITESHQATVGDRLNILLHRGEIECEVKEVKDNF